MAEKKKKRNLERKLHNYLYFKGLPEDITEEEIIVFF